MLRITPSKSAAGATAYFNTELSRGDYYAEKGEVAGKWHGNAAELLGLTQNVTREDFAALANNQNPATGEQLTPRMKADRRAGYDFTFSASKSVSAFYEYLRATDRHEQAAALLEAFTGSVRTTMAELETDMRVRVRANGGTGDKVTGNFVWAEFTHFQARPVDGVADPHLHTHAYAMNLTHDGEGWKAGEFGSIKRDATYYQEAFDARFAHALKSMGYEVEAVKHGFELSGVTRATVEKFSRRTEEVEKLAAEKGIVYAEDKARQGAATRKNKDEGLSPEETSALFYCRLSEAERDTFERIAGANGGSQPPGIEPEAALDYALANSFERASAVSEKRLLADALKAAVGSVLPEDLQKAAARRTDIRRGEFGGQTMVTTAEVLAEERAMLAFARDGRACHVPVAGFPEAGATPWTFRREWLSEEQREAVQHVLRSTDKVTAIRGGAGTGKTATLQETVEAVTVLSGKAPVILAPSTEASRSVLRSEGFKEADTVARFLVDSEMQAKAKNGFIFVDEAGLMGSRDMRALFAVAEQQNARILLQGDVRQHAAIQRGDSLRLLERSGGVKFAELKTIRRQEPEEYREAVAAIAKGDVSGGFAKLDRMGAIVEVKDDTRHEQVAAAFLDARANRESVLAVSPTHREGERVTALIREGLKARGELGPDRAATQLRNLNWTEAERGRAANYAPGQVVAFHQNTKGFTRGERATIVGLEGDAVLVRTASQDVKALPLAQAARFAVFEQREIGIAPGDSIRLTANGFDEKGGRFNNGSTFRVEGFRKDGGVIIAPEKGGVARVLPKDFGHVAHGYVATSHASQGKTVDRVLIAQGAESFAASSREQFYVSASRARLAVRVFTDDKAELARAVERFGERIAASDLRTETDDSAQRTTLRDRIMDKVMEVATKLRWDRLKERMHEQEHAEAPGIRIAGRTVFTWRSLDPEPSR
jgi:conjugative relaxase-like TrwC/TraI family protein